MAAACSRVANDHPQSLKCVSDLAWFRLARLRGGDCKGLFERLVTALNQPRDPVAVRARVGLALAQGKLASAKKSLQLLEEFAGPADDHVQLAKAFLAAMSR
ncbi:MAG: hypothetical protein RL653_124 [Pseudomonadota bacterium]|jgi:hypothetical protein